MDFATQMQASSRVPPSLIIQRRICVHPNLKALKPEKIQSHKEDKEERSLLSACDNLRSEPRRSNTVSSHRDQAAKGRTTIAIAYRSSTIQNADCIYFIKDGGVSESGTHDQLIAQKGDYYESVQMQALSKKV
ncbi:hypothetical protein EV421DRAFT_1418846 [Armillaria borealis]|uniref:P-loop containing nucleoside triphosphate hydrolase protein n=1 Tax=Armillaria borealis TaxID=47425 RepID=A0AA39JZH9_9AGAR|nr:hypothetical protein EV421DRAFT_1418846 [Armillaria borealis]